MQYITILILLGISVAVFFGFIDPLYKDVQAVKAQSAQLNDALNNTKQIQNIRDSLLERFNSIEPQDIDQIKKLLPNNIDNVRLILEIDKVAARHGMFVNDIGISETGNGNSSFGPQNVPYGSLDLSFTISGSYEAFRGFIVDLEKSLRLVDIVRTSFRTKDDILEEYSITVRTYWLK